LMSSRVPWGGGLMSAWQHRAARQAHTAA
jgi:hypothetical protein